MSERRRLDVLVHGRVQGVGYRMFAAREADRQGIVGWVANQAGGTVRAVGEAAEPELRTWLSALRRGPAGGAVSAIDARWSAAADAFDDFEIRSGWHPGD